MNKFGFGVLLLASTLYAQEATQLDKITISTATKGEKAIDGVVASVEVITIEDLRRSGGVTVRESLANLASINTSPVSNTISKSAISIRGMSGAGTLFLIDGKRLAGEVNSPYDLDRIPTGAIEKIEIVKGPMSTLYGADATGGVINIITKKPTKDPAISLDIQTGANKDGDGRKSAVALDFRGKKDSFDYSVWLSAIETSPYSKTTSAKMMKPGATPMLIKNYPNAEITYQEESKIYNTGLRLAKNFEYSTLGFEFGYMKEDREGKYVADQHKRKKALGEPAAAPEIAKNVPINSEDGNKRLNVSVDYDHTISDKLIIKNRLYISDYTKKNSTSAIDYAALNFPSEAASADNKMDANVLVRSYELGINYIPIDSHKITVGGEYRDEKRDATVFTTGNEKTTKKVNYKSLYLQDEWEISEDLEAIFGARYDGISTADDKTTFRAGLIKTFDPLLKIRASFAQGYRAPDLRELYINKSTAMGSNKGATIMNYNLKPESVDSYELAVSGMGSNIHYEVVGFYNRVKDRIAQVKKPGNINTWENTGKAEYIGAEASIKYLFSNGTTTKLSAMQLSAKNKDTKKRIDYTPEQKASASIDVPFLTKFMGSAEVVHTGSQKYETASKTADAYTLLNLKAKYNIAKEKEIFIGANNVADTKIDDALGSSVGTFYYIGARARF